MAIPSIPPTIPQPIAENGDTRAIPNTTPVGTNQLSFSSGFPPITSSPLTAGGIPPQREDFNAAYKILSQHSFFQQSGGVYPWVGASGDFPGLNYLAGWHAFGTNNHEYIALQPSGPDVPASAGGFVGPKNPVEDTNGFWLDLTLALQDSSRKYDLCEFYFFRHPTLRDGFLPAQGGIVQSAATLYPDAWSYLQTVEGQLLCVTETEWQTMSNATWATLADGTQVGWEGVGGVPYYALNPETGTMRIPDLRGMYAEAAGFDTLTVGGVHGDGIPRLSGLTNTHPQPGDYLGVFHSVTALSYSWIGNYEQHQTNLEFDSSRVAPTANKVQPRAWGALACVYLGMPQ